MSIYAFRMAILASKGQEGRTTNLGLRRNESTDPSFEVRMSRKQISETGHLIGQEVVSVRVRLFLLVFALNRQILKIIS